VWRRSRHYAILRSDRDPLLVSEAKDLWRVARPLRSRLGGSRGILARPLRFPSHLPEAAEAAAPHFLEVASQSVMTSTSRRDGRFHPRVAGVFAFRERAATGVISSRMV
jgi:hypothetical protein